MTGYTFTIKSITESIKIFFKLSAIKKMSLLSYGIAITLLVVPLLCTYHRYSSREIFLSTHLLISNKLPINLNPPFREDKRKHFYFGK